MKNAIASLAERRKRRRRPHRRSKMTFCQYVKPPAIDYGVLPNLYEPPIIRRLSQINVEERFGYNLEGERGLLTAILWRTMLDLELPNPIDKRDAVRFFLFDEVEPWSFAWICQELDIDHKRLRRFFEVRGLLVD